MAERTLKRFLLSAFAVAVPLVACTLPACSEQKSDQQAKGGTEAESGPLKHVTDATFEKIVLTSDKPVLVDFWAPWCGPCRAIAPIVEEIAREYEGKLTVAKLNTDENPTTAQKYSIAGIPSLYLFKNGKVVEQVVGAVPKTTLLDAINKHL